MDLDRIACYQALKTRDPRFDGRFYTGVTSTRVFCRPICPARTPKIEHCVFFPSAAAALRAGFRPCLRCRPELAPSLAGYRGGERTVSTALQLIVAGELDGGTVQDLARRLGVSSRQLRRLFEQHLGASPTAVARTHRILFAKKLLSETGLSITEVAFAAGFGSVRRFNDVIKQAYGKTPRQLRNGTAASSQPTGSAITVRLPYIPPYNWPAVVAFLKPRAIPGVEAVQAGAYRRTFVAGGVQGIVEVRPVNGQNYLLAEIRIPKLVALTDIIGRLRRLFDVDADVAAIEAHLGTDPRLASLIANRPGLRVPGAWDGFELAVRAILGQQVSVAAATTLAGRLVRTYGQAVDRDHGVRDLNYTFPTPGALADADLTAIGLPPARARAISQLAAAVLDDERMLDPYGNIEAAVGKLKALPGIGEWTARYIAMRALRDPDAFPAADLGLRRALAEDGQAPTARQLLHCAEAWRPWRAYAAMHLWMKDAPAERVS